MIDDGERRVLQRAGPLARRQEQVTGGQRAADEPVGHDGQMTIDRGSRS